MAEQRDRDELDREPPLIDDEARGIADEEFEEGDEGDEEDLDEEDEVEAPER
jgi:hypothetical protein